MDHLSLNNQNKEKYEKIYCNKFLDNTKANKSSDKELKKVKLKEEYQILLEKRTIQVAYLFGGVKF